MKIGASAGKWNVYSERNYQGPSNTLYPGKDYATIQSMELAAPVFSIRPY